MFHMKKTDGSVIHPGKLDRGHLGFGYFYHLKVFSVNQSRNKYCICLTLLYLVFFFAFLQDCKSETNETCVIEKQ